MNKHLLLSKLKSIPIYTFYGFGYGSGDPQGNGSGIAPPLGFGDGAGYTHNFSLGYRGSCFSGDGFGVGYDYRDATIGPLSIINFFQAIL
jgi:hypothetical protein